MGSLKTVVSGCGATNPKISIDRGKERQKRLLVEKILTNIWAKKQADKRAEAERKAKEEADYLASLTHHTDALGHKFTQEGTKKVTARYEDVWVLDPSDHKDREKWNDLASVKLMEKVWVDKFLAIRVADYETHSLFVCEAVVIDGKTHSKTNFFTYRIEKGKTGKFKDANKTKQLRVSEKIDLSQFPKVA